MKIQKSTDNGQITLKLNGWLDTLAAPMLEKEIAKIEAASAIILDFENVEYIASSGLRQVVACHRKAKELGASFEIINVGNSAMNIFKLTGLHKKIKISSSGNENG